MNDIKHNGNYLGIVVQNNDPEKRGRVKVFVPHINIALYESWNKDFAMLNDKHFVFPDAATNPDLDNVLEYLKKALPWAEIALPLFGGSASGRYNAHMKVGTTSDANYWDKDNTNFGFRPLVNYVGENRISDAFHETKATHNRLVNPNANQYAPSDYSNLARGSFTIPNVGAHVWVFFIEGDINYPVVFAVSQGQEDWKRIYSKNKELEDLSNFISPDYPESYENLSPEDQPTFDHNKKTFRAKHVFNSNKHSLEFIDTDKAEVLKMTHYAGSFLEMNNNVTTRFAHANDQTLVLGDQFLTVRKNQGIYIANYQETIIDGDRFLKLGDFEKRRKIVLKIMDILKDVHNYKMLFELMRTEANDPFTSSEQKKEGSKAKCPVCQGEGTKFDMPCVTCGESGESPSSQDGDWELDQVAKWIDSSVSLDIWQGGDPGDDYGGPEDGTFGSTSYSVKKIVETIRNAQKQIIDEELESGFGNGGDDIQTVTGNVVTTIGTVFNDMPSFRVDEIGKIRNQGAHIGKTGTYVSMAECPLVEYVDVDSPPGGDWDITAANKFRLNVGSNGIHLKTTGAVEIYGTIMNINAESLNVSSEWELLLQGKKRVEIRGDIINIHPTEGKRGYVLLDGNVGVRNNLTVVGGTHLEGELSYLHSTTPKKMYMTEIGYGPLPHTHIYWAPPWTLEEEGCPKVREDQQGLNKNEPVPNQGDCGAKGFWVPTGTGEGAGGPIESDDAGEEVPDNLEDVNPEPCENK